MNKKTGTTIITDIRNFTGLFEKFQYKDSDDFLIFIEKYYKIQSDIAKIISNDHHMGTTGDGVLTIFLSENSHIEGYAYLLGIHKALTKLCKEFGNDTSFGIGADYGSVWEIGKGKLNTYVGSVINRSSRIETNTKLFGNTQASIGFHLYNKLIEHFHPLAYDIMKKSNNYDTLLVNNPEVVLISKELMLFYIFEMELKGLEKPLPIFRLSETMAANGTYWDVMEKLLDEKKVKKLKSILS